MFYASDSGCSCPVPFEEYNSVESLTEVTLDSFDDFESAVMNHAIEYWDAEAIEANQEFKADKVQLVAKVHEVLRSAA